MIRFCHCTPRSATWGATDNERGDAYRAMLQETINDEDLAAIGPTCNNSGRTAATIFARWSKRKRSASRAYDRRIDRRV